MTDDLKTRVEARVKYLQHMKEIIPGNTIDVDVKLYYDLYSEIGALRTEDSFKHKVLEAAFSDLNKFRSIAVATDAELKQEKAWRSSDNKSLVKEIKDFQKEKQRLEQENAALREGSISPWFPYPEHVPELRQTGGLPPLSLPILFFSVDDYLYPSIRFGSFQEGKFTSFNNITYPKVILWRKIEYMEGLMLAKQALAAKGGVDE